MNGDAKVWLAEHDIQLDPAAAKRFTNVWRELAGGDDRTALRRWLSKQ